MRKIVFVLSSLLHLGSCGSPENQFELSAKQSMLIIGKGPGQNAALNPYADQESIAVVRNKGKDFFYVRIQNGEEFIAQIPIQAGETKEFELKVGYRLYLDAEKPGLSEVSFKPKS